MITLGEIVRRYASDYRARYGERMLASHQAALSALAGCCTAALGGHRYTCPSCATVRYSYHSCRNRHCPRCQHDAGQRWLERQQELLLPVPHFLVTFTLPPALRDLARSHQRQLYTLLFQASAAALMQLAHDPRFLGGQIGMLGVLQTWTRDLRFHPHIHYLVPAIGLARDGTVCQPRNPAFLVAVKPLAILFRAKLRAALRQTELYGQVAPDTWRQAWVVDCRPVGSGAAALKYLAPYIFRVALSNNRIVGVQDDHVTFRYRDGETKQLRTCTLPALSFIGRFLQHVVPKGFVKVRYYGLFSHRQQALLAQMRQHLLGTQPRCTVTRPGGDAAARRARIGRTLSGVWPADAAHRADSGMQPRPTGTASGVGRATAVRTSRALVRWAGVCRLRPRWRNGLPGSCQPRRDCGSRPAARSGQRVVAACQVAGRLTSSQTAPPEPDIISMRLMPTARRPRSTRIMWRRRAT